VRPGRLACAAGALLLLAAPGCRRGVPASGGGGDPLAEPRSLVEQRRFDDAIARLGEGSDAEALYLLGRAWAGKAESAPVPTLAPGSAVPGQSALKPEEEQALAFYERATAARPDHAAAHLAIAQLLAAHALVGVGARGSGARAGDRVATSVDRVLRSFGDSIQADPAGTVAVEDLIQFATAAGRVSAADEGFQELVRRRREDPEVLVRYGDFLAGAVGNADGALARYAQALIWRPDDTATRLKMAEIHLAAASALLANLQYAAAEVRLRDARRFAVDPTSPQAARLRELERRIREIRGR
jgi:tetratricopeptide (TPR) repeat protein